MPLAISIRGEETFHRHCRPCMPGGMLDPSNTPSWSKPNLGWPKPGHVVRKEVEYKPHQELMGLSLAEAARKCSMTSPNERKVRARPRRAGAAMPRSTASISPALRTLYKIGKNPCGLL